MEYFFELMRNLRDNEIIEMRFGLEYYRTETLQQSDYIEFVLLRIDDTKFKIRFNGITEIDFGVLSISGQYITHVKCFKDKDNFFISLDPYDEFVQEITSDDNDKFRFKDYEITEI